MRNFILLGLLGTGLFAHAQVGNVGINTVNPLGTLHIDGNKDNPEIDSPNPEQEGNDVLFFSKLKISQVGVGIVNPFANFHVISKELPGESPELRGIISSNHTEDAFGANLILYKSRGGDYSNATPPVSGDKLGEILIGGFDGGLYANAAKISAVASQNWSETNRTTNLEFFTTNGNAAPQKQMTLDASGKLAVGGNQSPVSTLDVKGSVSTNIRTGVSGNLNADDYTVIISGNVNLPNAADAKGRIYKIYLGASANLTINGNITYLGNTTITSWGLNDNNGARGITLQSDGSRWVVIERAF